VKTGQEQEERSRSRRWEEKRRGGEERSH